MKSFKFECRHFIVHSRDGQLTIEDFDEWGNSIGEITIEPIALLEIHELSEKLYPLHNPQCRDVLDARSKLEAARDVRTSGHNERFEEALKAYMDVSRRHVEAFKCEVFH